MKSNGSNGTNTSNGSQAVVAFANEPERRHDEKKHTVSLFVSNKPGVLIRIALVFARRGYNIDSLVVSETTDHNYSMMNIVATGDKKVLGQILKQLNKLVDVVHATDRTDDNVLQRELALIKIQCDPEARKDVLQIAHALECEPLDVSENSLILQITGDSERLDSANRVFERYGVQEMIRTGKVLMARGDETTA